MTPERWHQVTEIFHAAVARSAADRAALIGERCGDDLALRHDVDSLLAAHEQASALGPSAAVVPPPLAPGSAFGTYRVAALLGAGGMGEVYRAWDPQLARDVAIKVLPPQFTSDPDRLARFAREARALASLNHPHIGAIYGVEEHGGVRGLVLELVEGPTLADRIASGPLGMDEALRMAGHIAEALEAAHDKGIVHRDLKPANIKITPAGVVKVLDFGLARPGGDSSIAMTGGLSSEGLIVGTPGYMSPEQARGRPVDKRSDIWAFGCVVYEMLTGRSAFSGETVSDTIANVLEREPDLSRVPARVPAAVHTLLQRCLRKNPDDRLHDIADARIEIADARTAPTRSESAPAVAGRERLLWTGLALGLVAIGVSGWLFAVSRGRQPASTGLVRFSIALRDNAGFGVAVSPDGHRVAIAVCCGGPQIWVHSLEGAEPRQLSGTEGGYMPFWSPDGTSIGFFTNTNGKVVRMDLAGGPAVVVCDAPKGAGGSWSRAGVILFASDGKLFHVPAAGGTPTRVAVADPDEDPTFPQFLPDGRHYLYLASTKDGRTIRLGSLDTPATTRLVDSDYPARYVAPSTLLYLRGTALVAQPLNPTTLNPEGTASVIEPDVAPGALFALALFSASDTGVLAFVKTRGGSAGQLTWFDRAGHALRSIPQPPGAEYLNPVIAPGGDQVAVNVMDPQTGNWDVWVVDLVRGIPTRLTVDPAHDADPVWSPDGKEIVFGSDRGGRYGLYRKVVGGSAPEELVVRVDPRVATLAPSDWSADGKLVLFQKQAAFRGTWEMWAVPLAGDRTPQLIEDTRFTKYGPHLSLDGQWIAYVSFESGQPDVYVQRFMAAGEKRQISHGGGTHPRWTRQGRELVYWAPPGGLMSVDMELSATGVKAGIPKPLLPVTIPSLIDSRPHYDVTRDGERFLVRQLAGPHVPEMTVMINWTEKLKK